MNRIENLKNIIEIQCSDGNWNYDPYMHGLANGLLLALATLYDIEYTPLSAPEKWLRDLPQQSLEVKESK